jgi:hypothetical protein
LDVARLQPGPSAAACLDPHQHLLKDGGQDFLGWHVALLVWAVGEAIFLKEPTRAATALFIPIRVLVELLAHNISSPCFINKHADFTGRGEIFISICFSPFPSPFF